MAAQNRTKIAVAGAGGAIGAALCRDLTDHYDVVALVGTEARVPDGDLDPDIVWRYCEFFSRRDVERAISDCEVIVYLVHTRVPTARLDQAESENMDLLIADNVARAAGRQNIKQIIYLGGLVSGINGTTGFIERRNEVIQALSHYGTPLTVLRAGLVVAPGSAAVQLIAKMATQWPVVLIPAWANTRKQPIGIIDVIRAIRFCIGNQETYGQDYDIGGPVVMTFGEMLQRAAAVLHKKTLIVKIPYFPMRLYRWYLHFLDRQAHSELIKLMVDALHHDLVVRDNALQQFIAPQSLMPRKALDPFIEASGRIPSNPRRPYLRGHKAGLRSKSNVRSIQRIVLPQGRDAAWVADTFFRWLPRFAHPFVACELDDAGNWRIFSRFPRLHFITLSFQSDHSSPDRRLFFISGGLLARGHDALQPRFEFRDVLGGRYTIAAIHDFRPQLPWGFYFLTQAVIHFIAMRRFQKFMKQVRG